MGAGDEEGMKVLSVYHVSFFLTPASGVCGRYGRFGCDTDRGDGTERRPLFPGKRPAKELLTN